jgi:TRAP-type C4-dicarboxylate transport system substrate-binding protein
MRIEMPRVWSGARAWARGGAVLVLLAAGAVRAAEKPQYELKFATVAPEGTAWMKTMREIDVEVRKATGNVVGFKTYPGGVQGDETVVLRKIRSGQLHGGGMSGLGLGMIAPSTRVMELPFMFTCYEQVDEAYARVGTDLEKQLSEGGFQLLGWAEIGFVYLFSKGPIKTQSDLKSAKMWLWEGDPLAEAFLKQAGVVPVPLSITDVLTSLQTRLIDAAYSSPLACVALQWFTRVSYVTDLPISFASGAVVVSRLAFDRIPAAQRTIVLDICRKRFRELVEKTRKQNDEALKEIATQGVQRIAVPASEVQRFREVGERVWADQTGKLYSKAQLDAVLGAAHANPCQGSATGASR